MERYMPNTLFPYPDRFIELCEQKHGLGFSREFLDCANRKLTALYEKEAGCQVDGAVFIGIVTPPEDNFFLQTKWIVTQFSSVIHVGPDKFPATISWQSKSNRMYTIGDTNINETDIEFLLVVDGM
ncbi:hypothetical protein [Sediminibacterium ginsengisoli]|uniref:Uncharacterized protein n=1 Tax=Sediminibacterium ginsengisoli TaxID=413434 RepID=A0A1T4R4L9_9BACT|nr:hypothetical protein [Sediminibacterium ginsengisoli]SKA10859.1 hypothetical protein SAMN04488132_110126 [Sediminibacterium ginsengisoli]